MGGQQGEGDQDDEEAWAYPLLAGPWPYVRGLESKQFHCSSIKLESRALEIAPSFLCRNPIKGILFLAV